MRRQTAKRLICNLVIACLATLLLWTVAGMPSLTKYGAFRRAMKENLITGVSPQYVIQSNQNAVVLGEKEGVIYQVLVDRSGPFWSGSSVIAETQKTDGLYIVPLRAYWDWEDAGDIAVLAEGSDARCSIFLKGSDYAYPLTRIESQDGWFCFVWEGRTTGDSPMADFIDSGSCRWMDVKLPGSKSYHGTILFESYDTNGIVVQQGAREF